MKTYILILLFIVSLSACSQNTINQPSIEVTGSAEMTIIPDQVEMEIILVSSNSYVKNPFADVEKKFLKVLEDHKIPQSCLTFMSQDNWQYWYYWWYEYRNQNTKTYKLKIDCNTMDLSFIKDLDANYIRSIRITSTTHSKLTEYRKQVKVEAMKMAKEKAGLLLESVGQKSGKVLEITEITEPAKTQNPYDYWYGRNLIVQNSTSNSVMSQPSNDYSNPQNNENSLIPTIKLRFEIKAKFEIL